MSSLESKKLKIKVVDEDGNVLLKLQPHRLPRGIELSEIVDALMLTLNELYDHDDYYISVAEVEDQRVLH